jgi:1,4-dihydroxy-6-naphthoate synthase
MNLKLGISPCPNDTFSFYNVLHGNLFNGIRFDESFHDIENLNRGLLRGEFDVCKASFGIVPHISENYQILDAGSALGFGCGPLLVACKQFALSEIATMKIAIPGVNTTANRLLRLLLGQNLNTKEVVFSEIENAVLEGRFDAGLIIHESRFTYEEKGLTKIIDLGSWWEEKFKMPIPLGCIVVRRSFPDEQKCLIEQQIAESIRLAFAQPEATSDFVRKHAQAMRLDVMKQHIDLYVNEFSVALGAEGQKAVRTLLSDELAGITEPLFVGLNY